MRSSASAPATVYAGNQNVDERVRRVTRVTPSKDMMQQLMARLIEYREEVATHFALNLAACEEPQFLRYQTGDFFVAHQDGNTSLMRSPREQFRKISVVIFLNKESEIAAEGHGYRGGSLVFSDWRTGEREQATVQVGSMLCFRSELTHEVLPVTDGERYSIVSWYG